MNKFLSPTRAAGSLVIALLTLLTACSKSAPPPAAAAPPQVGIYRVEPQRQTITAELPGRTGARLIAEIRPQVGGIVQRRLFEEGAQVKAGQVLYQLDPASFQAAHAIAQAGVAKAEATVGAARVTAQRNAELVKIDAISQQLNDDSQAQLQLAQADLAVAQAAMAASRINLDRTRIVAPISGRIGLSSVTAGALVTANQVMALTTVQQLDPLVVDVLQSSSELLRLKQELASGTLKRNSEAPIRLLLEDGSAYPHVGQLQFSSVSVNPSTGAVTLRALIPNPDGLLMPGMYVRALLETGVVQSALLVPQRGITRTPTGEASALIVGADGKVERRTLKVGRAIADRWQVTEGLQAGERVIIEGLQNVKVGALVQVKAAAVAAVAASASAASGSGSAAVTAPTLAAAR